MQLYVVYMTTWSIWLPAYRDKQQPGKLQCVSLPNDQIWSNQGNSYSSGSPFEPHYHLQQLSLSDKFKARPTLAKTNCSRIEPEVLACLEAWRSCMARTEGSDWMAAGSSNTFSPSRSGFPSGLPTCDRSALLPCFTSRTIFRLCHQLVDTCCVIEV